MNKKTITINEDAWKELRNVQTETGWDFSYVIKMLCRACSLETIELISEGLFDDEPSKKQIKKYRSDLE